MVDMLETLDKLRRKKAEQVRLHTGAGEIAHR